MKTFGEYMYYLLSYPFKQVSKSVNQWYIYFQVVGTLLDKNRGMFMVSRGESTVNTCSHLILSEHGKERGLERYAGESYENFRKRISLYGEICQMGGTEVGTKLAVEALGFHDVQMIPCYLMDNNRERWAEFYVVITRDIDDSFVIGHDIIRKEVRKVKKVSAKDNYRFSYGMTCSNKEFFLLKSIALCFDINWSNYNSLSGKWQLDGNILLNNIQNNHPLCIAIMFEMINAGYMAGSLTIKYHWWTLDASHKMDGTRKLDAEVIQEEL